MVEVKHMTATLSEGCLQPSNLLRPLICFEAEFNRNGGVSLFSEQGPGDPHLIRNVPSCRVVDSVVDQKTRNSQPQAKRLKAMEAKKCAFLPL